MRALATLLILAASTTGCWKTEFAEIPTGTTVPFTPGIIAPPGWLVSPIDVDLQCPNKEDARFYFVYPESAVGSTTPIPVAVIYHSGAFDFVFAPTPDEPLGGTHFAVPSRLEHAWAIRHAFTTLGMLPNEVEAEVHTGALPVAFAERGVAMLFPTNCWGDLWHNRRGLADNDFPADLFARDGRTSAEWGYQFATDPLFAAAFGVELPVLTDPAEAYVVGLGMGGRAVGELLAIDANADGVPDHQPVGALVDSHSDDLRVFFDDPVVYGNTVAGLSRVFPEGSDATVVGSLYAAPQLPARFGYLYANGDPLVPPETHHAIVAQLLDDPTKWIHVDTSARHVLLNGDDLELARDAVSYLLDGTMPPAGPGVPGPGGYDTGY